jgi:hypothetical protein
MALIHISETYGVVHSTNYVHGNTRYEYILFLPVPAKVSRVQNPRIFRRTWHSKEFFEPPMLEFTFY